MQSPQPRAVGGSDPDAHGAAAEGELAPASTGGYAAALVVCLANLLAYFAIGAVVPVLPLYMRAVLGSSDVTIGVVMAAYAVTTLAGRPAGGSWGDHAGYRRPAALGAAMILAGTAAYSCFRSAAWLLACRLVIGFGEGMSQSGCLAWAVSLAPERKRAAVLSYAGVSGWAGVAAGALLGEAVLARAGYRAAFIAATASPVIGLLIVAYAPAARVQHAAHASLRRLARTFARQGAAYALVTVGYAAVLTFGALLSRAFGAGSPSLLLNSFIAGVIGVRLVLGQLPARLTPARTAAVCAAVQALGTLVVAATPARPVWTVVAGTLAGMGFGLSFPSLALDALARVSEADRGKAIGIVSAFFDVGFAGSGAVLGWIAGRAGYPAAFVFSAGCAAVAAALMAKRQPASSR